MASADGVTSSPGPRPAAYRVDRLDAAWSRLHVDVVETEPCGHGLRVRAVVDLDGLTPADVHVHLVPAAAAAAASWPADWRMWTVEPYGNGRVLFERVIARPADAADGIAGDWIAGDWVVVVHPASAIAERPIVYPLHLPAITRSP